jgi:hypothetical protein
MTFGERFKVGFVIQLEEEADKQAAKELAGQILSRRMHRRYSSKPVPESLIDCR